MIGRETAEKLARLILDYSTADDTQVLISSEVLNYTRFNQNWIHQNLTRMNHTVNIKVFHQGRVGAVTVNTLDESSLRQAVDQALHFASFVAANPNRPPLPEPQAIQELDLINMDLVNQTPEQRADAVGEIIGLAKAKHIDASGSYANELRETLIATSKGVMAYHAGNHAMVRTVVTARDVISGYADQIVTNPADLDVRKLGEDAVWKATLRESSILLPPGQYDTVFEATAVADLLRFPGYLAFGARAVQEGRSFMAKSMGQQVFSPSITIVDDSLHPLTLRRAFDSEGSPKKAVPIFTSGVATGVVYDTATADKEGKASTGHAGQPGGWSFGPQPDNMIVSGGDSSRDAMIRNTKRGLLVTRFHYTHCPEPMDIVATGTTRDGTFLIENGEIVARVLNFRFTESMIRAFANVEAVSSDVRLTRDWWSTFYMVLPAMKINGFTYTGNTTF